MQWTLRGDLEQQGSTSGESRGRSPDAETDAAFENEIEIDIGARHRHRASGIGHRASGIGHRASGIGHRASASASVLGVGARRRCSASVSASVSASCR